MQTLVKDVGTLEFSQTVIEESHRRPVVVDFWASWCGPCRFLGPILEKLAEEFHGDFLLAKIDIDAHPGLAQHFGVRSVPNVKVFKDGAVVDDLVGALPEKEVRDFLRRHCPSAADRKYEEGKELLQRGADAGPAFEETLRLDPAHPGALIELGKLLVSEGNIERAASLWEQVPYGSPLADQASKLKPLLRFQTVCREAGGPETCAARATANPEDLAARYSHACCLAAAGAYRSALDNFFYIVQRDKNVNDQAARKAMLTVFAIIGERSNLAEEYRRHLAMALF